MYKKTYEKMTNPILKYRHGVKILKLINKVTTNLAYLIYPIFLILLAYNRDIRFWKVFTIPAISFVLVSIFREYTNHPRPYEAFDIEPIIKKDTRGKSFPSRHVFSIFVIAMTLYYISKIMGIFLMFAGIILGIVRVLGGVHFTRDVIAGAVIGILSAIVGWTCFPF